MTAARIYGFIFILISAGLMSCEDDPPIDDFGKGSGIKGRINIQNEFQQPLYDERGGVNVYLEVGFRDFEVTADNVGNWQLAGAPVGTYTITFTKAGYSTIVLNDIKLSYTNPKYEVDNSFQKLPSVTLTKLPETNFIDFELELLSAYDTLISPDTTYTLNVSATMLPAPPPTGQAKGYRLFIGDSAVSPSNYLFQEYYTTTTAAISHTYENDWFTELNLSSGDAIFAELYGEANFNYEVLNSDSVFTFPNLSQMSGARASVVLP